MIKHQKQPAMKTLMYYLRMIIPTLLVIFILGGKPAKVKGQEPVNNEKKTVCGLSHQMKMAL